MKNRISPDAFHLPCPACILERPILLREELTPTGVRPSELEGHWAVCQRGYHALNEAAEAFISRIRR